MDNVLLMESVALIVVLKIPIVNQGNIVVKTAVVVLTIFVPTIAVAKMIIVNWVNNVVLMDSVL
jgi:hypothetical protein